MESVCKILENFSSVTYSVRFRRYCGQDCILIGSDITNHQLSIKMRSKQRKLTIT